MPISHKYRLFCPKCGEMMDIDERKESGFFEKLKSTIFKGKK